MHTKFRSEKREWKINSEDLGVEGMNLVAPEWDAVDRTNLAQDRNQEGFLWKGKWTFGLHFYLQFCFRIFQSLGP
jgi:hypothetical protein